MADLLTSLGEACLYYPRWTSEIHEEWIHNVIENRGPSGNVTREKLGARHDAMIEAIEDSLVEEYEELIPTIMPPDPDDRHVVSAAIKSEPSIIHAMGTVFEELVRKFIEETTEEAGEHWTPRVAVKLMANLIFPCRSDPIRLLPALRRRGGDGRDAHCGGRDTSATRTGAQHRGKNLPLNLGA